MTKARDYTGETYNKLTFVRKTDRRSGHEWVWELSCLCGGTHFSKPGHVISGKTAGCPACRNTRISRETGERTVVSQRVDRTGERYGRLVATEFSHAKNGHTFWKFICDCGNEHVADISLAIQGHTTSCGCYQKERRSECHTTHGMSKTRLYVIYFNMLARCLNKNDSSYPNYGGRGITVCEEWQKNFESFVNNLPDGYGPTLTLDRINPNEGYSPSNCRWVGADLQARNKRISPRNTSGVTGVSFCSRKGKENWGATWRDIDDNPRVKRFSIRKYGYDEAFRLACEYRAKMIEELNKQGAGYTPTHGL